MSDPENFGFGKFVPGFDFLQNLTKSANASSANPKLPSMGGWVAPTMNTEDLDKRIEELKTVQFWLDQNAVALKATIQALEVQKMTLATLKGMNISMTDLAKVFTLNTASAQKPAETVVSAPALGAPEAAAPVSEADTTSTEGKIDPMQWWDSLTQQFQQIATTVIKDVADKTAAANLAKENMAKDAIKASTDMTELATKKVAETVVKTVVKAAAKKVAKKSA